MRAAFHHAEKLAPRIATFWFEPLEPINFVAGQFTQLHLPHADADSRGTERWLTISSSPHEPLIGVTTSFAAHNGSSFKRTLHGLTPGHVVSLAAPIGDFVLPKNTDIPLVFVAAGLGITPAASILAWLNHTGERREITLLRLASRPDNGPLPFEALINSSVRRGTLRYDMLTAPQPTATRSTPAERSHRGSESRVASQLTKLARQNPEALFFLAGPEALAESLAGTLRSCGIAPYQIVADLFPGYA